MKSLVWMHIRPNLVNRYLCEMPDLHTNINIHETINSGQVFLWENHKNVWFGIDGSDIIQVKHEPFEILTLSKEPKDFFRNDDNYKKILKSISHDKIVKKAVKHYPGLRITRQDPFQCCISFIISANSNIPNIKTRLQKLCRKFGTRVNFDKKEFFVFPKPRTLANASINDLQDCGLGYRTKYVKDTSFFVDTGEIDFDYLKNTYPELEKTREDIKTIIVIESDRYENSKLRMEKIVSNLDQNPTVDDLIRLYESDGVTPDYLKEMKVISDIPSTFYSKLSELHQSKKQKEQDQVSLEGLPETELLYYEDDPKEFDAKVIKSFDKYVVLDKTSFYARGGGQEPDHGTIEKFEVVDVNKHGNVIVHELKNGIPKEGSTVSCVVDSKRRDGITKNHTSTHILNSSTRNVLGSWVWQHSAFKEEDHARLDITHHSALTNDEITKIEKLANSIVEKNMSVTIDNFDRGTAEQKYGFKIYQGGVVPVKSVRIVSIEGFDIEACGGTHVKKTGENELIKITRTKRIQDGVVRIEFVSGGTALDYTKQHDANLIKKSAELKEKTELKEKRRGQKQELREKFPILVDGITQSKIGTNIVDEIIVDMTDSGKPNFCSTMSDQYDEFFHISLGEKLIEKDPWMVYCGVFEDGDKVRAIIYSGEQAAKDKLAGDIAKIVSEILGGAGGGNQRFAQGGGKEKSKKNDAIEKVKSMVLGV